VPDLATDWAWDDAGVRLTFHLHQDVRWHDGKPFTAADVKCTWDLLQGKSVEKLRINPRGAWYNNLAEVVPDGGYQVTFVLKRPQPAFLALLASGMSPVYPCHVSPAHMRQAPIGTGPFQFVEFKSNEFIKVARNPDYWKPDRPYLDGIEFTVMREIAPAKTRNGIELRILGRWLGKNRAPFELALTECDKPKRYRVASRWTHDHKHIWWVEECPPKCITQEREAAA
jgi:ABC-type transport system substrate-binding protein